MYMRVTRFTSSAPLDDERIAQGRQRLAEAFGQSPGYLGFAALFDRATGKVASVTYWADAESMQASEEAGTVVRARVVSEGAEIQDVQRYERLIQERVGAPRTGVFARVTNLSIAPERIDELISHMKEHTVPQAKAQPGVSCVPGERQPRTGQVGVSSIWESDAAREASNLALSDERRQTAEHFSATLDSIEPYEVVALDVKLPAPA